ncbi:MAG: bifunctional phosphopantothenoylcysteine decarboxylase/phosphopantothenate--cysteine ligase CoaBC, partial [Saprospiraceae bacterium]|nr:bifunctional phosphopantothenoylcysteine decarboxylase/phosphopantothenate--cysteine ligase CoaBC [Saprospiraceae bacterium]
MSAKKRNGFKREKIIVAVTGSIAAYKSAFLTRLFIKAGAEVQILMTEAAKHFISPLTLSTLSKRPVFSEIVSEESWNNHVELGLWADAMVIAPATATTLAKMTVGLCDNIVTATYLSARCSIFIAPAMDLDMWVHPATLKNREILRGYGNHIIPVGFGELASGLVGDGRMAEPEDILKFVTDFFQADVKNGQKTLKNDFLGRKIIVTAGPTYEALDPVRFIGNRSSGKMGVAIAQNLVARGAKVTLILGPSKLTVSTVKTDSNTEG